MHVALHWLKYVSIHYDTYCSCEMLTILKSEICIMKLAWANVIGNHNAIGILFLLQLFLSPVNIKVAFWILKFNKFEKKDRI